MKLNKIKIYKIIKKFIMEEIIESIEKWNENPWKMAKIVKSCKYWVAITQ